MIKHLRIKIFCVTFAILSLFMLIVLLATYITSLKKSQDICSTYLQTAIQRTYSSKKPMLDDNYLPLAVLTIDYSGDITLLLNQLPDYSNSQIIELTQKVLKGSSSCGMIEDNIQFLRKGLGISDIRIAFADTTIEKEGLSTQLSNYIKIFFAMLILFALISRLFAIWISKPVETFISTQKDFIANASHELKTPLTIILSNVEFLSSSSSAADNSFSSSMQKRISFIQEEARHMNLLIKDMLQIAQTESTLSTSSHELINFSDIINYCVAIFEPIAYDNKHTISFSITESIMIYGNEYKIRQLVNILLDNAIKYSAPDSTIQVTLISDNKSSTLSVESIGTALPKELHELIFLKFYRLDDSRKQTHGYGLGLSIAKLIAEEHSGKIWVESDDTKNSNTFYVKLRKR